MWEMANIIALGTVCISLIQKRISSKEKLKTRIQVLKHNTVFYYFLIYSAITISFFIFGRFSFVYSFLIYIFLFSIHELQWYLLHTGVMKDEIESTQDFYTWCNQLNDSIVRESALVEEGHDFSEGIFNGDFTISNGQAMQNKYDLYYEYLKLQPGMKLLDIGCGNGHWGSYLKQRGIDVTGIVICKENYDECIKKGIRTILGDARFTIKHMKERFDAVSAIGPVEHFASISQLNEQALQTLQEYFNDITKLIDPNSSSKMYINSIITMNQHWSKYRSFEFLFHFYLIASVFGSGYYPFESSIENIYNSNRSKIRTKRDYTEDYRYIYARCDKLLGHFRWRFNTFKRIGFLLKAILTDPYWPHRLLFGISNSWLWQFGGTRKTPMPENKDTPIRSYIYVVETNL